MPGRQQYGIGRRTMHTVEVCHEYLIIGIVGIAYTLYNGARVLFGQVIIEHASVKLHCYVFDALQVILHYRQPLFRGKCILFLVVYHCNDPHLVKKQRGAPYYINMPAGQRVKASRHNSSSHTVLPSFVILQSIIRPYLYSF